jgi:hypothetical protein
MKQLLNADSDLWKWVYIYSFGLRPKAHFEIQKDSSHHGN